VETESCSLRRRVSRKQQHALNTILPHTIKQIQKMHVFATSDLKKGNVFTCLYVSQSISSSSVDEPKFERTIPANCYVLTFLSLIKEQIYFTSSNTSDSAANVRLNNGTQIISRHYGIAQSV
jgi:hypothetical protein